MLDGQSVSAHYGTHDMNDDMNHDGVSSEAAPTVIPFPRVHGFQVTVTDRDHDNLVAPSRLMRMVDVIGGLVGTIVGAPFIMLAMLAIWLEDRHSPFYVAERVGAGGKSFRFIKLRSISGGNGVRADEIISARDPRVTRLGHFLRASKIDELPQFWHVLAGQMSLVGPRANVRSIVDSFTAEERRIVSVRPGITDLASVVFLNLGKVLADSPNPKLDYNRLVRPWKSRLALIYVDNPSFGLAVRIMALTVLAFFSHDRALRGVSRIAQRFGSDPKLPQMVLSKNRLEPYPPPGADEVISSLKAIG
ncbi:MAG: sugar transferase [Sphingomonadales bacterium]